MSRRPHPIDNVFRQKLEHHASETPDYLWQGIVRQRNMQRTTHLRWRERLLLAAALLLFVYASLLTWHMRQMQPSLGNFPISVAKVFNNTNNQAQQAAIAMPTPASKVNNEPLNPTTAAATIHSNNAILHTLSIQNQTVENLSGQFVQSLKNLPTETTLTPANPALSAFQLSILPITLQQQLKQTPKLPYEPSKCAAFSDHKVRFYFDVLASPDVAFRNIQATTSDFESYAATRKETEAARYNYSLGARFSAVSNSGMALRAGINYSEINERFELLNGTRIVITYDQNGNIIGNPDTITDKIITNNRYQTLDIPVMIGYEIPIKKMTLAINGGAYFNLHFKPEGEFLSPYDNRPVSFSNNENPENTLPAFREKLGVGWYGSVGVHYKISPHLQVLVEPHLRSYTTSFTRDDFMTEQKYLTAGIFVGLRHQFSL